MSVSVALNEDGAALRVEVRDSFDFDTSRSLLSQCRPAFGPNLKLVTVELSGVRTVRSCALGTLLLLSEHAGPIGVVLRLRECPENVEYLFSAGMFGRHFKTEQAQVCPQCLEAGERAEAGCPSGAEAENGSDGDCCDEHWQAAGTACFDACGQSRLDAYWLT